VSLFKIDIDTPRGLELAARVHAKYRPVFDSLPQRERAALAFYFLPHESKNEVLNVTRPRVLKWYCPFADQRVFPSGHRYCINVYTGCEHACDYCYAAGYVGDSAHCKDGFRAGLAKDLSALDMYDVPPAPVHISNSTDPLQPLEQKHGHTLFTLRTLAANRARFTTVTVLTKNPNALTDLPYLNALHQLARLPKNHPAAGRFEKCELPALRVECSLAFFNDESRKTLDAGAPSVQSRLDAIRALRREEIPVVLRIDPLFPRDPLTAGKRMGDFDLPELQKIEDLAKLLEFCRDVGVQHVVYSVAKITRPRRGDISQVTRNLRRVYGYIASEQALVFRGGSWRLPNQIARDIIVKPFLHACEKQGVIAQACKENLISTP
jgi:DNA repair photolyase